MSKLYNQDVILYRLDAIERRLDNVERTMLKSESPDIVHILLDLIKNGTPVASAASASAASASAASAASTTSAASAASSMDGEIPVSNFDNLAACIARRRTIV